jgi:hypothetical protein
MDTDLVDEPAPNPASADFTRILKDTITLVVEYIILVLIQTPEVEAYGQLPESKEQLESHSCKYSSVPEGERGPPFAVVIYGTDRHTATEVTRQIRDAMGVSLQEANYITRELDTVVSDHVLMYVLPTDA